MTYVGLGFMIVLIPVNIMIFAGINIVRVKKTKFSDMRVKLMNEILSGIRIIKYYAWEGAFQEKVLESRAMELYYLKVSSLYYS